MMFSEFKTIRRTQQSKDKVYSFRGAQLTFSIIGKGAPVILLHGSMVNSPWKGFEQELAKNYQVYLPELPGFGASDSVENTVNNIDLLSDALCEFIRFSKLQSATIIAFSLGSVVAVKASEKGGTQGKLILVGMPVRVTNKKVLLASLFPVWIRRLIGSTVLGRRTLLIPLLREVIGAASAKSNEQLLGDIESTDTRSLVDFDVRKEINNVMGTVIPTLSNETVFIYGSEDKLLDGAKEVVKKPTIVTGAGHNVFSSQPKELLKILESVLKA